MRDDTRVKTKKGTKIRAHKKPDTELLKLRERVNDRVKKACKAHRGVRLSAAETRAMWPHWAGPR